MAGYGLFPERQVRVIVAGNAGLPGIRRANPSAVAARIC
jgi:hypothetical protein